MNLPGIRIDFLPIESLLIPYPLNLPHESHLFFVLIFHHLLQLFKFGLKLMNITLQGRVLFGGRLEFGYLLADAFDLLADIRLSTVGLLGFAA